MVNKEVSVRWEKKEPLVVGTKVFHSKHDWELSKKELEKACVELGETEEAKRKCLEELRNKLLKDGNYRTDDEYLLRFLRVRKFNLEVAYKNVKHYYNMRTKTNYFVPPSELRSRNVNLITVLPYMDEDRNVIFWMDLGLWDQRCSFEDVFQPVAALADIMTVNPKCQVNGVIGCWDFSALSFKHASECLRKNSLLTFSTIAHFSIPWRIKKVVVFNTGRLARFLYGIVKPILSKKVSERMILLGSDLSELHEHINPAILPKKLGGELEDDFCRDPNFILDNIPYLEYDRSFTGEKGE